MILVRDHRFFAAILSQMDLVRVDTMETYVFVINHEICNKIYR